MHQEKIPAKYKILCRIRNQRYTEELRCDDLPRSAPFTPQEELAFRLLHSFSPEILIRKFCEEVPGGVLVFRTDADQMAEFASLLHPEVPAEDTA